MSQKVLCDAIGIKEGSCEKVVCTDYKMMQSYLVNPIAEGKSVALLLGGVCVAAMHMSGGTLTIAAITTKVYVDLKNSTTMTLTRTTVTMPSSLNADLDTIAQLRHKSGEAERLNAAVKSSGVDFSGQAVSKPPPVPAHPIPPPPPRHQQAAEEISDDEDDDDDDDGISVESAEEDVRDFFVLSMMLAFTRETSATGTTICEFYNGGVPGYFKVLTVDRKKGVLADKVLFTSKYPVLSVPADFSEENLSSNKSKIYMSTGGGVYDGFENKGGVVSVIGDFMTASNFEKISLGLASCSNGTIRDFTLDLLNKMRLTISSQTAASQPASQPAFVKSQTAYATSVRTTTFPVAQTRTFSVSGGGGAPPKSEGALPAALGQVGGTNAFAQAILARRSGGGANTTGALAALDEGGGPPVFNSNNCWDVTAEVLRGRDPRVVIDIFKLCSEICSGSYNPVLARLKIIFDKALIEFVGIFGRGVQQEWLFQLRSILSGINNAMSKKNARGGRDLTSFQTILRAILTVIASTEYVPLIFIPVDELGLTAVNENGIAETIQERNDRIIAELGSI